MDIRSLCVSTVFCGHTFPGSLPAQFHFPKLHELFHCSVPSLLGNTMVTELAEADLISHHNKHNTHHAQTHFGAIDILYPPPSMAAGASLVRTEQ